MNLDLFWKSGIGICFEKSGSRDSRLPTPGQPERLLSISRPQKPQFHRNSITFYRLEFRGRWICLRDSRGGCFVVEMGGGGPGGAREKHALSNTFLRDQKNSFFLLFRFFRGRKAKRKAIPKSSWHIWYVHVKKSENIFWKSKMYLSVVFSVIIRKTKKIYTPKHK